jgi:RNA polymerase sigma factor (sigma-70 family)
MAMGAEPASPARSGDSMQWGVSLAGGDDRLALVFEEHRPRLRAMAYRMLGSLAEADDAVQDAWLRLSRSGGDDVANLGGWLTTVTARLCLNVLQAREVRREEPVGVRVPDPLVGFEDGTEPEQQVLLADSVGLALLVVLDTLAPAERLAFVLHDMFGVAFEDIALIAGRSPAAVRQLASRSRRRVQAAELPVPDPDPVRQRAVVDAFFAASRRGDFDALVAVLDPAVLLRADHGSARPDLSSVLRGAAPVARQALTFSRLSTFMRPAIVNGTAGAVVTPPARLFSVMGFTVTAGRIVEINVLSDPERLRYLEPAILGR